MMLKQNHNLKYSKYTNFSENKLCSRSKLNFLVSDNAKIIILHACMGMLVGMRYYENDL